MPQQKIKFEQYFAAPRDKVFAFFADHEKFGLIWGGLLDPYKAKVLLRILLAAGAGQAEIADAFARHG